MKTKSLIKPIFSILLMLSALWWSSCGTTDDNGPCPEEDWVYQVDKLPKGYDSLYAYDGTQKTLLYLYSNDTIVDDTLTFELYQTDTIAIERKSWEGEGGEGCTVYAKEVKTFYY